MATWKFREIKQIIEYTPAELKGKQITQIDCEYIGCGCYTPSGCNWCYAVYVINYKGRLHQVVTTFGSIK